METAKLFREWEKEYADDAEYELYGLLHRIADQMCQEMARQGLSRAELAERLGVSRQYITKFLNTPRNTTLETVLRFAAGLGLKLDVGLRKKGSSEATPADWDRAPEDVRVWRLGGAAPRRVIEGAGTENGSREAAA